MNYFYDLPTEIQRKIKFDCLSGELLDCILKRNDKITKYKAHEIWCGDADTDTPEKRVEINIEQFWANTFYLIEYKRRAYCPVSFLNTMPAYMLFEKIKQNGLILQEPTCVRKILIMALLKY